VTFTHSYIRANLDFLELGESDRPSFTYVQGMNVLAAPFLYTMPSELEAFYCFASFIEVTCPAYVQPTLEGVHRGLKVGPSLLYTIQESILIGFI
jgi:cell cycle arrest protein BUB2